MSTLIRIPSGHMRFVPAHKQTDDASMELKPTKWPVELVLIANALGREAYLDNSKIQTILAPAIQATCRLNPEETIFSPPPLYPRHTTSLRTSACPTRSLPHSPAISTPIPQTEPSTPPPLGPGQDLPTRADSPGPATACLATITTAPEGYTSSQLLPKLVTMPPLTGTYTILPPTRGESSQIPHPWTPKFIPETGYTRMAQISRATQG